MSQSLVRLSSKVIIYDGPRPLLVTPSGIREITSEDVEVLKRGDELPKSLAEVLPPVEAVGDGQMMQQIHRAREAWESAKNLASAPDLKNFHENHIVDGNDQFEEKETTLSHLYRFPHPALRHRSYGEALCDRLLDDLRPGANFLEIGCGTGLVAKNFLDRLKLIAPGIYASINYCMFDLSPALQATQEENCREHLTQINFIRGDIQEFNFNSKFDVILANEMIADLEVEAATLAHVRAQKPTLKSEELVCDYQLDTTDAPPLYLVNVGALKLVEKAAELLQPNGIAILTEFGSQHDYPVALKLAGHFEHTIRFADLEKVAQVKGMQSELQNVAELLNFDSDYELMSRESYALISDRLLPHLKLERLKRLPYDRKSFTQELGPLAEHLINVQYYPLKAKRDLLNPYRFFALVLRR